LLSALHAPFFSLLDLIALPTDHPRRGLTEADKGALLARFLHLEFYQTFLRDVAWPFSLSARQVQGFVKKFEGSSPSDDSSVATLCSTSALHHLLSGLVDIGTELWAVEGVPHDFLCPITLERMTDPVVAADGHTY
jgi:hypothetical protein